MKNIGYAHLRGIDLTPHELEIVKEVAEGYSNIEIGKRIHLSAATIKTHLARVTGKINARNRAHIAAIAIRNGWI